MEIPMKVKRTIEVEALTSSFFFFVEIKKR